MATVVVVEDHALLAETLRLGLEARGIPTGVLAARPLDELSAALLERRPTLVLLDLDLGEFGDSTPLIAPLIAAGIRVLVVSGTPDRERIAAAFDAGAVGYCAKRDGFDELMAKTERALASGMLLDPELRLGLSAEVAANRARRAAVLAPFARLTEREQATLHSLCHGASVTAIAADWVVSEATVRSHVRAVLMKLGVSSQLAAVALALRTGWFTQAA